MLKTLQLAALLALAPLPALAHADHIGPNGGYAKHVGTVHIEVAPKGNRLTVHVLDVSTDKPIAIPAASTARATLLQNGKSEAIPLKTSGPNQLSGLASASISATARIALTFSIPNRPLPPATFNLGAMPKLPKSLSATKKSGAGHTDH
jgi:hypothetical protein